MHVIGDFVRSGRIAAKKFFIPVDLSEQVTEWAQTVEGSLDEMTKVIRQPSYPEIQIGAHRDDPYTCPLHEILANAGIDAEWDAIIVDHSRYRIPVVFVHASVEKAFGLEPSFAYTRCDAWRDHGP